MEYRKLPIITLFLVTSAVFSSGQTQSESGTGIEGVITIGPTHGGPIRPGMVSFKPFANATFIVKNENEAVVASFTTDDQGQFRISLNPGHYTVSMKDKKSGIGRYGPFEVDVVTGKMTKVQWEADTGIR